MWFRGRAPAGSGGGGFGPPEAEAFCIFSHKFLHFFPLTTIKYVAAKCQTTD